MEAILEAVGSGLYKVVKATVYITDLGLWDRNNAVVDGISGDHISARTVVKVKDLHFVFQMEVKSVASV